MTFLFLVLGGVCTELHLTSCSFYAFVLFCIPTQSILFFKKSLLSMRSPSSILSSIWMVVCVVWVWQVTYTSGTSPIMTMLLNMVYNHSFAAYFIIETPGNGTQLVNNVTSAITWAKGVEDGIFGFDLEMTRMSVDGLYLIARNGQYVD